MIAKIDSCQSFLTLTEKKLSSHAANLHVVPVNPFAEINCSIYLKPLHSSAVRSAHTIISLRPTKQPVAGFRDGATRYDDDHTKYISSSYDKCCGKLTKTSSSVRWFVGVDLQNRDYKSRTKSSRD